MIVQRLMVKMMLRIRRINMGIYFTKNKQNNTIKVWKKGKAKKQITEKLNKQIKKILLKYLLHLIICTYSMFCTSEQK